jgi:hypothetical protein
VSTDVESALRDSLVAEATAMPVPPDPWTGFAARERTHRRSRRVRLAVAAAAVTAAVGVQTNVVPLPGWAPGIAVAGRETALTNSPTRGSLAGDLAWQRAMRHEVKDVQDPDALWKVSDRKRIKFVYAGDIAGHRFALMLVPLRFGFITDSMLTWYEGPAGAAPGQMIDGSREDGGDTVVTYTDSAGDRPGLVIVVAPTGSTVSISPGFSYSAAGRVERLPPVTSEPGSGLGVLELPPAPYDPGVTGTVVQGERTLFDGTLSGGWSDGSGAGAQEVTDAMTDAALAGHSFDRAALREWLSAALHNARLPASGTTLAVRWTGVVDGAPAVLFTLHPRGGGVLAYAMHGRADSWRQDLRVLLPAAGADQRAIAWRMRAEGKDDRTDQLRVVAPAGAARVDLVVAGGAPVPVALDASGGGAATLPPGAAASVVAYRADGSLMSTTPVTPFETSSGGIPGSDLKTRIVP